MLKLKEINALWSKALISAAHARDLGTIAGFGYVDDGTHVCSAGIFVPRRADVLEVTWDITIKPIELDDVLRAAFMPELKVGAARRRSLRVAGAFAAPGLELDAGTFLVPVLDDPAPTIDAVLDRLLRVRREYLRVAPRSRDFIDQVHARVSREQACTPGGRLREALALIVAGEPAKAIEILETSIAGGENGPMSGPSGAVFPLLVRYLTR